METMRSEFIVNKQFLKGGVIVSEDIITDKLKVHKFITTPAKLTITKSNTTNLGNYNSKKLVISLTMPCYKEQIEESYKEVMEWVDAKLQEKN